jgi:hypothetical protein
MSSMQRTMFKQLPPSTAPTTAATNTLQFSEDDDFQTMLAQRLSKMNIDGDGASGAAIAGTAAGVGIEGESRSGSLRSPLSRQESRQNSVLSTIINPKEETTNGDGEGRSDSRNGSGGSGSEERRKLRIYGIEDLIKALGYSSRIATRYGIGHGERELLYAHLYRMIVSSNSEAYMGEVGANDEDFTRLVEMGGNIDIGGESGDVLGFEWEAWMRCVVAYGCVGVDEVASEVVDLVFPLLFKIVGQLELNTDDEDNAELSALELKKIEIAIWAIMSFMLFIFHDSENHGMLEHTKLLLHYLTNEKLESDPVIAGCLNMVGLTLTLAWESGRNIREIVEDEVLEIAKLILVNKKRKNESKSAASALAGLCYELLNYRKDDEEEDKADNDEEEDYDDEFINEEFAVIKSEIESLANEGAKKVGKKAKGTKSILRQAADTLDKVKDIGELDSIPISKSKNITIKSWFTYTRVQVLRFVLGNELSNWLSRSRDIRRMLNMSQKSDGSNSYNSRGNDFDFDDDDDEGLERRTFSSSGTGKTKKEIQKERTIQINRNRRLKEDGIQ